MLILDDEENPWRTFLEEFFSEMVVEIWMGKDIASFAQELEKAPPDIVFVNEAFLTQPAAQKIKAHRDLHKQSRIFGLFGKTYQPAYHLSYDQIFIEPIEYNEFQRKLIGALPLPETIRFAVIDDEEDIGCMIREFYRDRSNPSFQVEYFQDGLKGIDWVLQHKPDAVVLDIKMPKISGIDIYRKMKNAGLDIPVIIFFDAIFGDEVVEIHKVGRPVIIEKGTRDSQMPYMFATLLKLVYFGQ